MGTPRKSTQMTFRSLTFYALDSLANRSAWQVSEADSRILEELFSLKSPALLGLADPIIFSLRMCRDCLITTWDAHLPRFLRRWMKWGMTCNGNVLTAKTLASPRTGSGCSLSDILESDPDPKYFLSEKAIKGLLKGWTKPQLLGAFKGEDIQEGTIQA